MVYNIKLKEADIQKIRDQLGIENGIVNLSSGIIQVRHLEQLKQVSENYAIDNVNKIAIELLKLENNSAIDTLINEQELANAFDENKKKQVDIKIGSIVRVKRNDEVIHAVVIAKYGECYDVAKMVLDVNKVGKQKEVILQKDIDVTFKNKTYKSLVKVISATLNGLHMNDFLYQGNGTIVGEIINEEKMNQIFEMFEIKNDSIVSEEEIAIAFDETKEIAETIEEITEETIEAVENEELVQEEIYEIYFESEVENSKLPDELIYVLKLENTMIEDAIKICIDEKRTDFKKLLSLLQHKYEDEESEYSKLRQNALKIHMNEELANWIEKEQVKMKEYTVSYLLKTIVKKFKSLKKN